MIFDTLNLVEMEIISKQFEFDQPLKTQSIDSLTKKDLNHLSLAELLSSGSVVFVKSYGKGSLATAAFRGTASSHTKVLWNGFELNSPMLGQVDLSLIPNAFYDEAEIAYGGSSLESTGGALGGSINLSTNKQSNETLFFTQSIGSFNTYTSSLKLALGKKQFKSNTAVYLNTSENSFEFYNNAIIPAEWQTQQQAAYSNKGFTQSFDYKFSDNHSINFISWNQWDFREIPPIMSNQQGGNNKEEQTGFNSRNILKWNYQKSKTKFEAKAAWLFEDMNYLLKTSSASNPNDTVTFIDSKNTSNTFSVKTKASRSFKGQWTLSGELQLSNSSIKTNNYSENKNRDIYGILIKASKGFGETIKADLLLRQQIVDGSFIPLMPLLGVSIQPLKGEELFIRLSGNLNYNLPSLNDLYWFPGGNPDLLPEKGIQFDGGINYTKSYSEYINLSTDLSFFSSQISNWIQWVPSDYRYWQAENIAVVHARGIEAGLSLNGKINKLFYKVSTQYSFNKSTNESDEAKEAGYSGRQLIYVPLHQGNAFLFLAFKRFQFNWNTQFTGKRNTSLNKETQYSNVLPAYSLSNVSVGRNFALKKIEFELKLKANNIFNETYQAMLWRPMPGRSYEVFLTFKIK